MIGRLLRWIKFLWKLNSCEILGEIGTTSGLKDKNLPKFCKLTTIFTEVFEVFDLSDLAKIRITEAFAISHDSVFPKLTIHHKICYDDFIQDNFCFIT